MTGNTKPQIGQSSGNPVVPQSADAGTSLQTANGDFYDAVSGVLRTARAKAYRAINSTMVEAYWNVGRMIVEEEQRGQERAEYGTRLLQNLAIRLSTEFGRGYGENNLRNFRQLYLTFPAPEEAGEIRYALRSELTWTHYRDLMRVENLQARLWYLNEAADQNWSTRALTRQINSHYYERLLMSRDKEPVIQEMMRAVCHLSGLCL